MALKRVGKEIASTAYWEESQEDYTGSIDSPYHRHRLEVVSHLLMSVGLSASSACVDFGCGTGVVEEYVATRFGARIHGLDQNPDLIATARERCKAMGDQVQFDIGGISELETLEAGRAVSARDQ